MSTSLRAILDSALAGRYRIERELGAGGMATVYLAEDVRHKRFVALKVLHPELSAVLGTERFLKEIELTASLQHPHILPLFDSGEVNGQLYYVMPLVDGDTLRARLERERQLPVTDALRLASEVADALQYAHEKGVIHRDIKPENILLQGGHALVADFGIALAVQQAGGQRMTQTGLSLGTPQYMAPEQAMGEKTVDARADVYALGAVTYEMLTGEPPFTGPSAQAIVAKVITERAPSVRTTRPNVPEAVDDALATALEKLPADRFATAAAFAAALRHDTGSGERRAGSRTSHSRSPLPAPRLFRVGIGAVTLGTMIGWFARRPQVVPARPFRVEIPLPDTLMLPPGTGSRVDIQREGARLALTLAVSKGATRTRAIWVREPDRTDFRMVPGTEGMSVPVFSPDGQRLALLGRGGIATLGMAPLDGGPIADLGTQMLRSGLAWAPDGAIYGTGLGADGAIVRVSPNGGGAVAISRLDAAAHEVMHSAPSLLPNGKGMLMIVQYQPNSVIALYDVAALDLRTHRHRVLVRGIRARYVEPGILAYVTADGKLMAAPFDADKLAITGGAVTVEDSVAVSPSGAVDLALSSDGTLVYTRGGLANGGPRELVWIDRAGAVTPLDTAWHESFDAVAISPDGRRIAASFETGAVAHVAVKELASGAVSRITFDEKLDYRPSWLPDGRRVAYVASEKGGAAFVARRADGVGSVDVLARDPSAISQGVVSPDGQWVIYRTTSAAATRGDVFARRVTGDTTRLAVSATNAEERFPTLSPDGRWIAYRSDESGRPEVYVRPFPNVNDGKWIVSRGGGSEPRWSHAGTELFYIDDADRMIAATVRTSGGFVVTAQRPLFTLPLGTDRAISHQEYDVTPDDRRFLFVRAASPATAGRSAERIVLVQHWADALRARMGMAR